MLILTHFSKYFHLENDFSAILYAYKGVFCTFSGHFLYFQHLKTSNLQKLSAYILFFFDFEQIVLHIYRIIDAFAAESYLSNTFRDAEPHYARTILLP